NQHIVKASLPTSHSYISPKDRTDANFVIQFECKMTFSLHFFFMVLSTTIPGNGTMDYTPFLSVAPAMEFRNWLGGEEKINDYCHDLALKGGKRLAEILGTRVMDPDGELTFNMVNVELPFPGSVKPTAEIDHQIKEKLLRKYKAFSAYFYHNGRWWTRASAQVWNELDDFEKVGKIWLSVCAELKEELGVKE
ncbi:hypothetical protein H0H93_007362, partial [Arthromyces matolae]